MIKIYIFACNNDTMTECIEKKLFGVKKDYVRDISIGDYCLLYNFDIKMVFGLWKAKSKIGLYDRNAWNGQFHNQVKVERVSKSLIQLHFDKVKHYLQVNNIFVWKLYGNRAQDLLQMFAHDYYEAISKGLALDNLEEDYRNRYPKKYRCADGHEVRSLSEQTIDNWLFSHKIVHSYEPIIHIPEKMIPDFEISGKDGQVYLEFWGMLDDPIYKMRMQKKLEIYAKYKLPLIELNITDLQNLDFVLSKKLRQKGIYIV